MLWSVLSLEWWKGNTNRWLHDEELGAGCAQGGGCGMPFPGTGADIEGPDVREGKGGGGEEIAVVGGGITIVRAGVIEVEVSHWRRCERRRKRAGSCNWGE